MLVLVLLAACGTPPHKEMDQAQGAIDAARTAVDDRYAPDEFRAAERSLTLANEAVSQRDYRLALNHALESREHTSGPRPEVCSDRDVRPSRAAADGR